MNSLLKGLSHTVISLIPMGVAFILATHSPVLDVTVGQIISVIGNVLLSYFVPTTTGASVAQSVG